MEAPSCDHADESGAARTLVRGHAVTVGLDGLELRMVRDRSVGAGYGLCRVPGRGHVLRAGFFVVRRGVRACFAGGSS